MKKMKKIVALVLAAVMVMGLVACGKDNGGTKAPEAKTYDITVWCAANAHDLTVSQIKAFNETNTLGITFNATVNDQGEGDAATAMITSVEDGADLYFFASDQFSRLMQAKALAKLGTAATETVKNDNAEGSVKAVTADGALYAFPCTADNGYFLYYDSSVLSADDVKSMETIISKCEAAGKTVCFNIGNAWYTASYFFGTGCVSEWTVDDKGKTIGVNDTFNSDKGLIAAKGMFKLTSSKAFIDSSDASACFAAGAAAVVSGTWDYEAAKGVIGDKLAATKLPTFEVDGKTYQLGSFSGYKHIGVKPQSNNTEKQAALQQLALYLTSEKCQSERFATLAWGPSNKAAQNSDAVKSNIGQRAISEQDAFAVNQSGSISGSWWDIGNALGTEIKGSDGSEKALKSALETYKAKIDAIFTMSDDVKNAFTVIGAIAGTNWDKDFAMTKTGDVWKSNDSFDLKAGDQFKVRQGLGWDVSFGKGTDNFVVEADGTYYILFDEKAETVSLEKK